MDLSKYLGNKNRRVTLEEVLELGQADAYTNSNGGNNRAWNHVIARGHGQQLTEALRDDGFRKFKYVGAGDNAIIAKLGKGRFYVLEARK